jgi:hypothetical protein
MKSVTIPTSFSELTIGQLIELISIQSMDKVRQRVHSFAILTKCTYEDALNAPLHVLAEVEANSNYCYAEPTISKPKVSYKLGMKYYYPLLDLTECSAGQYIDAKNIIDKGNAIKQMDKLIACFLLPAGVKYSVEVYNEVSEAVYKHMSVEDAYSLSVFFCKVYNLLTADFQSYTVKEAMEGVFKTIPSSDTGVS